MRGDNIGRDSTKEFTTVSSIHIENVMYKNEFSDYVIDQYLKRFEN